MQKFLSDNIELCKQFHPTKNILNPNQITFASAKKVWWICEHGHEWEARVFGRTKNGSGCPVCKGKKADATVNIAILYPQIAAEWHPTKNGDLTPDQITPGSAKRYWWICLQGHEWKTSIIHRTKDHTGCPYCCNQKADIKNCLATLHPEIAIQWHPKNDLTPFEVVRTSHKRVWWQCPVAVDHVWEATVYNRTAHDSGCPCCSGRKIVNSNCLSTTHPLIAAEWHPTKNKRLSPNEVTAQSNKYIWFQCLNNKNHVWRTKLYVRTKGSGCPECSSSFGEKSIAEILTNLNVKFKQEYTFNNCKHKRLLPFDFAIYENNDVKKVIEFQGRHHYEAITYFGGEKAHQDVILRDKIKKEYCEANNIPLLIIPHWEIEKIPDLIEDFLK